MNTFEQDMSLAREIARRAAEAGGRAVFVGGVVRDGLRGAPCKDIDLEGYGLAPRALRELLSALGDVVEKGATFGVYGLAHSNIDVAMPRRERRTGDRHTDFDVSVDPNLSFEAASMRRDFTINAMLRDALTGELIDLWGGQADLAADPGSGKSDQDRTLLIAVFEGIIDENDSQLADFALIGVHVNIGDDFQGKVFSLFERQ